MICTKNKKRILFLCVLITVIFLYKQWKKPKLRCNEAFVEEVKMKYNADSVKLVSTVIQEEIYFEKLKSITLYIYNPTTSFFDFKKHIGERLENFEEIDEHIEIEGKNIAKIIHKNCSCEGFNNIMIVFLKSDDNRFLFSHSYDNCR